MTWDDLTFSHLGKPSEKKTAKFMTRDDLTFSHL